MRHYSRVAFDTRFWAKVDRDLENPWTCWLWTAIKCKRGYGYIAVTGQVGGYRRDPILAHRASWILHTRKPIPEDMCVCHRCDEPSCVNPAHLFLSTLQGNSEDCSRKKRHPLGARSACIRGHTFAPGTFRWTWSKGKRTPKRVCIACRRITRRARREARKAIA